MSNSKYIPDCRKSGKLPEKSSFAQTCNLLSQYMKEKGNLRDITLGINGKLEALGKPETPRVTTTPPTPTPTMNLLNTMKKSADLFPHYAGSSPATMEPKAGQMTILYRGQVIVFDDFPAEKVMEMLILANKGNAQHTGGFVADRKIDHGNSTASASNTSSSYPALDWHESQAIGSDMPIARRASLHRFFEKRKDRATARAPYQLHNPSAPSPKRDQEEHFDLNL